MVWIKRSFRTLGVLLVVLMITSFVVPCGPVRASDDEITVNVRIEGYRDTPHPDGTILPACQVTLSAGSTALDALKNAAAEYGLDVVDSNGFVSTIGGQENGHFDSGDGWLYRVNGCSPDVGAGDYVLQDGDTVLWYYGNWIETQYPAVYQFTTKDGYLNITLLSDSSSITGVNLAVYDSVYASVYSSVYSNEDGTYTVVFADDQGNLLPPGEYTLKAEKFREDGFPEMVKPEPVTISIVEGDPTSPSEPNITSATPRGSQGIEVSGNTDPGAQVVVTAVDSDGNEVASSKPVFADASGRFKAYLDIADGGTYGLTATATKLAVKVEPGGKISEGSLPSAASQFSLDVVEKPEILSAEYDPDTDSVIVELSRSSADGAMIIVTLSIFGMEELTEEVQTEPDASLYEVTFDQLGIQAGATCYCTITAKAVLGDKESVEDTYFFDFSIAEVEEANLAEKAAAYIYSSYLLNGVLNEDNAVGSYALSVLKQAGVDVSIWERDGICLEEAALEAILQDADDPTGVSAKRLAQDILAAQELGESDLVQQLVGVLRERHSEFGFDRNIYSDIPAYDLLGRVGYLSDVLGTVEAKVYAKDYILAAQDTDPESETYGAFGSVLGEAFYPDFVTTAQAVRALQYLGVQGEDAQVQAAIQAGLEWIQAQQQEDGSFAASDGDDPLIDTVEVIATLDVLDIEPTSWAHESTEKTPVDYMEEGALNEDGSFGSCGNVQDAVWALYGYHLLGLTVEKQLTITPSIMSLEVGSEGEYTLRFHNSEGVCDVTNEASWSVDDSSVASVEGGHVTALSAGQTTVTAVYSGLTAAAVVKVEAAGDSGGDGAATPSTCTVGVAVVGPGEEVLYEPMWVPVSESNEWGLTALGALDAAGVSYEMSSEYPGLVESICGIANEGMAGWLYTVNDSMPMVPAGEYEVSDGDWVIWYYSESIDQEPPKWDDLMSRGSSETTEKTQDALENLLAEFDEDEIAADEAVTSLADIVEGLGESGLTGEIEEQLAEVIEKTAQLLESLPDKAFKLEAQEEHVRITVDEELFQAQIEGIEKAAEVAEKVAELGISGGEDLLRDMVVVELPTAAAGKKVVSVELSAGAARQLTQSTLNLLIRSAELELTLPPEAVDTVLEATEDVSQIEITTKRIEPEEVNTFEGADVVGGKVLDIAVTAVTPGGEKSNPKASFQKKVVVMIPLEGVDMSQVNVNRLAAYRQKESGEWEYVGGTLSADGKFFTFETEHLSVYALMEYKRSFDDISGHWAEDEIESMAMRLIVRGMGDGTFAPDQGVTRAQFAALLVKALGIEGRAPLLPRFNDVAPEYWGYPAIEAASHAGLVLGTGKGRFEPERNITREEMAAMIVRALEKSGVDVSVTAGELQAALAGYEDAGEISSWAKECIAVCIDQGIIKGRTATTIEPGGGATRAEAVVLIAKMLQRLGKL